MSASLKRPRRGFTLLELVVASTVALLVFGAASTLLIQMSISRRITAAKLELTQDATLAMGWMRRDVYAGGQGAMNAIALVGGSGYRSLAPFIVPNGTARTAAGTPAFSGSTLAASANIGFTIIGDVPRPDSLLDNISSLPDLTHTATVLLPTNELSGRLNAAGTSRPGALVYGNDCTSASPMATGALGCVWGYRKYVTTSGLENIQVVFPNGDFLQRNITTLTVPNSLTIGDITPKVAADLKAPFASSIITQIDRIGFLFDSATRRVYRRQCWGNPLSAGDSQVGFALSLAGSPPNCTVGTNDTGWVAIARNVELANTSITLRDGTNTATTNPANVYSVEVNLTLSKNVKVGNNTRVVRVRLQERFFMRSTAG